MASPKLIDTSTRQIDRIERWILKRYQLQEPFLNLLTLPGVGETLAITILLETGPIVRFRKVGSFVSYCRLVSSQWTSNDKIKGKGNANNGNPYLAWAFSEAAEHARRSYPMCRSFYNRKLNQKNKKVAHQALAHKRARAAYYSLKDHVQYNEVKMFS